MTASRSPALVASRQDGCVRGLSSHACLPHRGQSGCFAGAIARSDGRPGPCMAGVGVIDDEAPTPRPFQVDPRLLRRGAPSAESVSESGPGPGAAESRGDAPRPRVYDLLGQAPGEPRPWQPVAGPADRASFFAEQARHRRATWRLSVAAALSICWPVCHCRWWSRRWSIWSSSS